MPWNWDPADTEQLSQMSQRALSQDVTLSLGVQCPVSWDLLLLNICKGRGEPGGLCRGECDCISVELFVL